MVVSHKGFPPWLRAFVCQAEIETGKVDIKKVFFNNSAIIDPKNGRVYAGRTATFFRPIFFFSGKRCLPFKTLAKTKPI